MLKKVTVISTRSGSPGARRRQRETSMPRVSSVSRQPADHMGRTPDCSCQHRRRFHLANGAYAKRLRRFDWRAGGDGCGTRAGDDGKVWQIGWRRSCAGPSGSRIETANPGCRRAARPIRVNGRSPRAAIHLLEDIRRRLFPVDLQAIRDRLPNSRPISVVNVHHQ